MIQAIAFDLWNCLAHDVGSPNPVRLLASALGVADDPDWERRLARGMMLAPADGIEGALRQLEAREGLTIADPAARRALVERWRASEENVALFPDVLPTLEKLRGRFRVGLCSNTQSFGIGFLQREGLWERLDASAFSFEVGALKPRPEIFRAICGRLGQPPETVLMVGDHAGDDIAGARAAGMQALRIARPAGDLSHREPPDDAGDTAVLRGLDELPARLARIMRAG